MDLLHRGLTVTLTLLLANPVVTALLSPTDENPHVTFRHVSLHSTPESQLLVSRHIFSGCVAVSCVSTAASSRQLPNEGAVYSGHSRSKPEHNLHPRQKCTTRNGTVSQTLLGESRLLTVHFCYGWDTFWRVPN